MNTHQSTRRRPHVIDPAKVAWTIVLCVSLAAIIVAAAPSFAQSSSETTESGTPSPAPSAAAVPAASEDKEKALHDAQNPIANTISVPFQNNTYFTAGPLHKTANVLIIEPVIPMKLNEDWNVIGRYITPIEYVPRVSPDQGSEFGLGNLQPEFYLSPAHSGSVIWGVGPKLYLPTATNQALGINRMGGGPAAVALTIQGHWVAGLIANNVWAGSGKERVNQMTLNPFVDYNMKNGWYFVSAPVITSNWVAKSSDRWTVPLGGGIGRMFKIGDQAVNARFQGLYNVVRPDYAPSWQLQLQVQFLFPKK
jgi:hypothetical protein